MKNKSYPNLGFASQPYSWSPLLEVLIKTLSVESVSFKNKAKHSFLTHLMKNPGHTGFSFGHVLKSSNKVIETRRWLSFPPWTSWSGSSERRDAFGLSSSCLPAALAERPNQVIWTQHCSQRNYVCDVLRPGSMAPDNSKQGVISSREITVTGIVRYNSSRVLLLRKRDKGGNRSQFNLGTKSEEAIILLPLLFFGKGWYV